MRTLILILLCLNLSAQLSDKDKHYLAGVMITNWAGSSAYYFGVKPFKACLIGFGAGCLAGFGKDYINDKMLGRGVFDKKDIQMTVWGSLVGAFCLRVAIDRNQKKYNFVEKYNYEQLNN